MTTNAKPEYPNRTLYPLRQPSCQKPTSENGISPSLQIPFPFHHNPPTQPPHPSTNPPPFTFRQNNDSLTALQQKVSALRGVTVDIYDNARDQGVIDTTSETFSTMGTSLKGSARRLGTMASQGNKVAVLKLAGIVIAVVVVVYWLLRWIF